jgi:serine/threonine protein kinase
LLEKTKKGLLVFNVQEQLLGNEYNEKSDVWSLGVILYELCALQLPFLADSQFELMKKVTQGRLQRIPATYSDELFSVIRCLLEVDVSLHSLIFT